MTIKLISRQGHVLTVPDRWARQYYTSKNPDHIQIMKDLRALKDSGNITIDAVTSIIGNDSWCAFECSECGEDFDYLVRIGQEPDNDSRWVDLCKDCAAQALGMFPEASHG